MLGLMRGQVQQNVEEQIQPRPRMNVTIHIAMSIVEPLVGKLRDHRECLHQLQYRVDVDVDHVEGVHQPIPSFPVPLLQIEIAFEQLGAKQKRQTVH